MAYLLLAGVLMVLDQRGQFVPRFRALAEQAVAPIYLLAELPVRAVRSFSTWNDSWEDVQAENQAQREQLLTQAGEVQRLAALEEENARLRAMLDATTGRDFSFLFAELVMVSLDPYSHQVLIDQGADGGVFEGQAVLDGQGIMGQVENVMAGQARVRLISDPEHAIPVQLLRTGQRTVALGTGDAARLALPNLPIQSDIREGDVLVTSGLGDRFPPGFPVAEVIVIKRETGEPFLDVVARPLAALDRGREVLLVTDVDAAPFAEAPSAGAAGERPEASASDDLPVDEAAPASAGDGADDGSDGGADEGAGEADDGTADRPASTPGGAS